MRHRVFFVLFLAAALAGCSTVKGLVSPGSWLPKNSLKHVSLLADVDANQTSATQLNVVFLFSETALQQLPASAADWFANQAFYTNALAGDAQIVDIQLPPDQKVCDLELPSRSRRAHAIVLFANYLSEKGQSPLRLDHLKEATVVLENDAVELRQTKEEC